MNERQQDELMALSAIYPGQVEWRTINDGADDNDQVIDVSIKVDIDWDTAKPVNVWDWVVEALADEALLRQQLEADTGVNTVADRLQNIDITRSGGLAQVRPESDPRRNSRRRRHKSGTGSDASTIPRTAARVSPKDDKVDHAPRSQPAHLNQAHPKLADTGRLKFQPPPTAIERSSQSVKATTLDQVVPKADQPKPLKLRYLPPLQILCTLGRHYPGEAAPMTVSVKDDVGWLGNTRLQQLEEQLRQACTEDECLLLLVDLVTGPALIDTLNLSFPLDLRQSEPNSPLSDVLSAHNDTMTRLAFSTATFDCALCLSSLKGASCVSLKRCGHVACLPCLKSYFGLCITEGLVRSVACPDPSCTKARADFDRLSEGERAGQDEPGLVMVDELRTIVGSDMLERYLWLKEKQRIESDPAVAFCPRESCRSAVPRPNGPDFDDGDKLRVCPKCQHSFCVVCLRTWHGTRNACSLPASSSIVSRYLEGDDQERSALELRYGRANIKRLVAAFEEERANTAWRQQHSTQCPGCSIWVERSQGCAHMQCARCGTHFCFKCAKSLSPTDPYKHYSTPGMPCYNKLFDFTVGQEPRVEEWIGQVLQDDDERELNEVFYPQGWNPFV
ncbi:hypothetical protein OIV83_001984 [Microbotryomycetes sp. JL201]|nr:hypothetical protein OIV83_001984 [Microbotryomycetes sp. JL201]